MGKRPIGANLEAHTRKAEDVSRETPDLQLRPHGPASRFNFLLRRRHRLRGCLARMIELRVLAAGYQVQHVRSSRLERVRLRPQRDRIARHVISIERPGYLETPTAVILAFVGTSLTVERFLPERRPHYHRCAPMRRILSYPEWLRERLLTKRYSHATKKRPRC